MIDRDELRKVTCSIAIVCLNVASFVLTNSSGITLALLTPLILSALFTLPSPREWVGGLRKLCPNRSLAAGS